MKLLSRAVCVLFLFLSTALSQKATHTFAIGETDFLLDGKPFQITSGEMHFARIPREYWHDRLKMAKAMGLNTNATYIFWNYHETETGKFNFSGNADVAKFVKTAQEEGLWVLVRPSPYACAEWEFGGYPWWLINEKNMKVRSKVPQFLEMSRKYFKELGKQLAPLQITRGGNIIMVQLENEYGSYDKDKEFLTTNKNIIRESGFDVKLYTCAGPSQMPNGYLPGLLPAVNWGKGCVWVNGHSIGRYRYIGPQQTLYVPGPWLKKGRNEVVIVEILNEDQKSLRTLQAPILDQLAAPSVEIKGRYDATKGACILRMETKGSGVEIFYTTDGSEPTTHSKRYDGEFALSQPASVAARAFPKGVGSEVIPRTEVCPSLSTGKSITLTNQYSSRYPGGGNTTLVDGFKGSLNYTDGF